REFGVISALVLGDKAQLDVDLRRQFVNAGVVHILAVSGLHVGIIYFLFGWLFDLLLKKKGRLLKFILLLLILWAYAALTGFSPSVLRAATMFSFISLGKYHWKYGNVYNMIAGSAVVLLVVDPLLITQVGFQLSYLAVIGIVYFHPKFYSLLTFETWLPDKIWSLTCVSLSAQLATFPLSVFYFHQFPVLFPLSNLLVIPLATAILYLGISWLILSWVPFLSSILEFLTIKATYILNLTVETFNELPIVTLRGLYLTEIETILLYSLIVTIAGFVAKPIKLRLRFSMVFAGFMLISLTSRSLRNTFQDRVYAATLEKEPTFFRLVKDEVHIYSNDSVSASSLLKRELMPFLLSKGIKNNEKWQFQQLNQSSIGAQDSSVKPIGELHLLYDYKTSQMLVSSRSGNTKRIDLEEPLTSIEFNDLIRFSVDQPLPEK
ncbi:MAG: ComEC/Rec2 family competence protein, partial [Bacteroidota bacterium]